MTMYNNLKWCNNKSKILYLPLEWEDLMAWIQGKLYPEDHVTEKLRGKDKRRLGFWRWRGVKLDNDYDGFFTGIMTQGYLLDGGQEGTQDLSLRNLILRMKTERTYYGNFYHRPPIEAVMVETMADHEKRSLACPRAIIPIFGKCERDQAKTEH